MTSQQTLQKAYALIKSAEHPISPVAAAASGLFGPIGASLYEHHAITEPSDRWGITGRAALGGSIGSGIGWVAGIPVSLATGIPILPTLGLSALGGMTGSAIGAWRGANDYNDMVSRHQPRKKKEKRDEH